MPLPLPSSLGVALPVEVAEAPLPSSCPEGAVVAASSYFHSALLLLQLREREVGSWVAAAAAAVASAVVAASSSAPEVGGLLLVAIPLVEEEVLPPSSCRVEVEEEASSSHLPTWVEASSCRLVAEREERLELDLVFRGRERRGREGESQRARAERDTRIHLAKHKRFKQLHLPNSPKRRISYPCCHE